MKRAAPVLILILVTAIALIAQSVITSNDGVLSGQATTSSTAANLGTTAIKTICIVAATGNSAAVFIGGSNVTTANGLILNANNSWCANVKNLGAVYVVSAASQTISWAATK